MRARCLPPSLLALALAAPLAAQAPAPRSGPWLHLGGGPATADMDCGRCEQLPDSIPWAGGLGLHGSALLGRHLSSRLALGGEAWVYGRRRGQRDATLLDLRLVAQLRPIARLPLFVRAGAGIGGGILAGGGTLVEAGGVALHAAVGTDVRRVSGWRLTSYAGTMRGSFGGASVSRAPGERHPVDPPRRPTALYLGLGLERARR